MSSRISVAAAVRQPGRLPPASSLARLHTLCVQKAQAFRCAVCFAPSVLCAAAWLRMECYGASAVPVSATHLMQLSPASTAARPCHTDTTPCRVATALRQAPSQRASQHARRQSSVRFASLCCALLCCGVWGFCVVAPRLGVLWRARLLRAVLCAALLCCLCTWCARITTPRGSFRGWP